MAVVYSPFSSLLYTVGANYELYLHDGSTNARKFGATVRNRVNCFSSSPVDDKALTIPCLTTDFKRSTLSLINRDNHSVPLTMQIPGVVNAQRSVRQGSRLYLSASEQNVYVLDLVSQQATILHLAGIRNFFSLAVAEPWLAVESQPKMGGSRLLLYKIP